MVGKILGNIKTNLSPQVKQVEGKSGNIISNIKTNLSPQVKQVDVPEEKQPEIKPVERQVDATKDTVSGQITTLLDKSNPYMDLSRKNAQRTANSRGLINSTMAARAGEEAAIASALPIAQQDASTYFDQGKSNQGIVNKFLENRQSTELNKELSAQQNTEQLERNKELSAQQNTEQLERMGFDRGTSERVAKLQTHLDMQRDTHSAKLKQDLELILADVKISNDMKGLFATEMSRIMTETQNSIAVIGSSDRSPEQQAAGIDQLIRQRDSQIELLRGMMQSSTNWDWFNADVVTPTAAPPPPAPTQAPPPPAPTQATTAPPPAPVQTPAPFESNKARYYVE